MNVWPVITRELRSQARQPFTYLLRLYAGAALLVVACLFSLQPEFRPNGGPLLFVWLHRGLLLSIWILIPLSAADCISQERREGTLGLLFLTPLTARDIVAAKCLAHGLRAFSLWLASLPIQMLPFLIGGLAWETVLLSCLVNFCSILLVVGISALASALCVRSQRAVALTAPLGAVVLAGLAYALTVMASLAFALMVSNGGRATAINKDWWELPWHMMGAPAECLEAFLLVVSGDEGLWIQAPLRLTRSIHNSALVAMTGGAVFAGLLAVGLMALAASIMRRRWRDSVRSACVERLEKTFCRPVIATGLLRYWLRRRLHKNPIGWLEQRSWSGRIVIWAWLAVMVVAYSSALSGTGYRVVGFDVLQMFLIVLLLLSVAATASGSFRRERESGVLELLLVSPLSAGQIIAGRLRGIWMQFVPSVVLLLFVWFFSAGILLDANPWSSAWLLSSLFTIPVIGLRNSIAYSSYVAAFIATLAFGFFVPLVILNLPRVSWSLQWLLGFRTVLRSTDYGPNSLFLALLVQLVVAWVMFASLRDNLLERRFARGSRVA